MCFFINTRKITEKLKEENKLIIESQLSGYQGESMVNGFSFPQSPVVLNSDSGKVVLAEWGLVPGWSKDKGIQKYTLNARIESLNEKPSYRNSVSNRCLILVNGFYEWKWLDEKGKSKQRYYITLQGQEYFTLGGIYSEWADEKTGESYITYSQVTTEANLIMAEIHNTKKRMPVILSHETGQEWLAGKDIDGFSYPLYDPDLKAIEI